MIDQHLKALRRPGSAYSKATAETATRWLLHFQNFCNGRCPSQLKAKELLAWQKELTWTPGPSGKLYSESSVFQAVGAVRRFYRWALAEGYLKSDPTGSLVTKKAKPNRSNRLELSPSDARKLLGSTSLSTPSGIRDRAIFGLLLETGISKPVCVKIDLAHLQLDTGALITKGRSTKIHCLSPGLQIDIERYLREARPLLLSFSNPALFLNSNGDRIAAASVQQSLSHHRKLCGL